MTRTQPATQWYRNRSSLVLVDVNDDEIQTTDGDTILVFVNGNNVSTIWS